MSRKGFTLLELVMVIVVLLILAGITSGLLTLVENSRRSLTENRVHSLGIQAATVASLRGAPPERLSELLPTMGNPAWFRDGTFVDGWDRPLEYRVDGKKFDLWSCGADGISGTPDDIHFRRN